MNDIASMQTELEQYRQRDREAAVNQAVTSAIQASGVAIQPGTEAQVASLLRPEVVAATANGQTVLAGPNLRSLPDHVRDRLNSPEFAHFKVDAAPAARPAGNPADNRPVSQQGAMAGSLRAFLGSPTPATDPVAAGGSMGSQILASSAAHRAAAGNPVADMSQPFGLRRPR